MKQLCRIIALILILLPSGLFGQDSEIRKVYDRYGVYAHFNLNMYNTDFKELPGIPNCCPKFERGTGTGGKFGLSYYWALTHNIAVNIRAEYNIFNARLEALQYDQVILNDELQVIEFEHSIDIGMNMISFQPMFTYRPIEKINLHAGISPFYILNLSYDQVETLIDPEVGTFKEGGRERNKVAGDINDYTKLIFFISLGISYDLPLNTSSTFLISPEIFFHRGLNNILPDYTWTTQQFTIGISIKYFPAVPFYTPLTPEETD